jgi:branched-subunit amino acid aminotransferase/4-amino-4-deoxychorismate lyase
MLSLSPVEIITFIAALGALIWGMLERKSRIRASNGQYVASLASAAYELVQTYRDEVLELRTRLARLEQKLEVLGCSRTNCKERRSLQMSKSS